MQIINHKTVFILLFCSFIYIRLCAIFLVGQQFVSKELHFSYLLITFFSADLRSLMRVVSKRINPSHAEVPH